MSKTYGSTSYGDGTYTATDPNFDSARHASMENFQIPSAGYYWFIGMEDAVNRLSSRNLTGDNAQYQADYDGGFAQGQWNMQYTRQEWM
jgi:hypothetical protein